MPRVGGKKEGMLGMCGFGGDSVEAREVAGRRGLKDCSKGLLPAAAIRLRAEYGLPMVGDKEVMDVPDMPSPTDGPYGL